ncbi:MAG: hypothetical protein NTW21_14275 [Verrucomicrobia bacterium]|nr:hypothetical protein [Verrucomicrobiota bacterium]
MKPLLTAGKVYANFVLRLKFKLTGKSGFINAGVQDITVEELP